MALISIKVDMVPGNKKRL